VAVNWAPSSLCTKLVRARSFRRQGADRAVFVQKLQPGLDMLYALTGDVADLQRCESAADLFWTSRATAATLTATLAMLALMSANGAGAQVSASGTAEAGPRSAAPGRPLGPCAAKSSGPELSGRC